MAAIQLSQQTTLDDAEVTRVVLASESSFADALASAVLQQDGPLLLVPPSLPLPGEVVAELERLGAPEVVLLGGEFAIGEDVEDELNRLGFATSRIAGATRIDTAVAIARQRPNAVTALLLRAFDASGGNGTGAWADSVAAGALSAQLGLPILLTDTDELSAPVVEYLSSSGIGSIIIVGGAGAVSTTIEQQLRDAEFIVNRAAGETRYETALAIAGVRRLTPERVVFVDGVGEDGWQGGLVAARHAWLTEAPILPVTQDGLPASIADYVSAVAPSSRTCVRVLLSLCQGGDPATEGGTATVLYNPPSGSAIGPGEVIVIGVDDPERSLSGGINVSSDCTVTGFTNPPEYVAEAMANFGLTVEPEEPGGDQPRPSGAVQVQPRPGDPFEGPHPGATAEPIEENEPTPVDYPTTCQVTTQLATNSGGQQVDVSAFNVVDLRPRIALSTFPQVEDSPIAFTDRSGGPVDTWLWAFGDGSSTTTEENPTHTYGDPGCYSVTLDVTSSLTHWFTGAPFTKQETRLVSVDPSDREEGHVDLYVVDGFVPEPGETVDLYRLGPDDVFNPGQAGSDDAYLTSEVSGPDGVATFADVLSHEGADGYGLYLFVAADGGKRTFQVLAPGQTLCPGLQLADVGSLLLNVTTDEEEPRPIPDASVYIPVGDFDLGGKTTSAGQFSLEDLPVGVYNVIVRAPGYVTQVRQVTIQVGQATTLDIPMPRP